MQEMQVIFPDLKYCRKAGFDLTANPCSLPVFVSPPKWRKSKASNQRTVRFFSSDKVSIWYPTLAEAFKQY